MFISVIQENILIYKDIKITKAKSGNIYKIEFHFEDEDGHKYIWESGRKSFYERYILTKEIQKGFKFNARYSEYITRGDTTYIQRVKVK